MFKRKLKLRQLIENKSVFLLGPRQTGKSSLILNEFRDSLLIDLLSAKEFRTYSSNPEVLEENVRAFLSTNSKNKVVIIDEIQKLPELLNEVHRLIEKFKEIRFVLTGSSARKLRKAGVNLLGGRARKLYLHPITFNEFLSDSKGKPPLQMLIQWGGLPSVLNSKNPREELEDYLGMYLKEEIQAEAVVRSLEAFSRFLDVAASVHAEQVIFSNVGSDAQVPARTVREYFQVLEDTLVGKLLPAFEHTDLRKAMTSAKFYFFDQGIVHALLSRWTVKQGTPEFGKAFEATIWRELSSEIDYSKLNVELFYWRSLSQMEVDFVLTEKGSKIPYLAIEAKGKITTQKDDFKGLRALGEEFPKMKKILVNLENHKRMTEDQILVLPVEEFLKNITGFISPPSDL